MKNSKQDEKWTLPINGREMTFSKDEIISILEKHFSNGTDAGQRLKINPLAIDRNLFKNRRPNRPQEMTRQIILEAFERADKYPEKYAIQFEIMTPKKKWTGYKTVQEMEEYAEELGGQITDVYEQALGWAQRISNGESWENICNSNDFKLIACERGYVRINDGSNEILNFIPIIKTKTEVYGNKAVFCNTIPVITIKPKN